MVAAQQERASAPSADAALTALVQRALDGDGRAVYWLRRLQPYGEAVVGNEYLRVTQDIIVARDAKGQQTDETILFDELISAGRGGADDPFRFYAPNLSDLIGAMGADWRLDTDAYAGRIIQAAKSRRLMQLMPDGYEVAMRNQPGEANAYASMLQLELSPFDELLADASGVSPFRALRVSELLKRPRAAMLDAEMSLRERQLALIFARPNDGKTLYLIWRLCERAHERRHVVYITGEGQSEIGARIMAAALAHNLDMRLIEEHLRIIEQAPQLVDAGQVDELIEQISAAFDDEAPIAMVALDTLGTATEGQNENAPETMSAATGGMRRIMRAFDCAGILTHHSGKDATRGERGHSSLRGTVDVAIELTREDDSNVVVAHRRKVRDGEKGEPRGYTIVTQALDEYADTVAATLQPGAEVPQRATASKLLPSDLKMLRVLQSLPSGMRYGAWVEQASEMHQIPAPTAKKAIARLREAGMVGQDDTGLYQVMTQDLVSEVRRTVA